MISAMILVNKINVFGPYPDQEAAETNLRVNGWKEEKPGEWFLPNTTPRLTAITTNICWRDELPLAPFVETSHVQCPSLSTT